MNNSSYVLNVENEHNHDKCGCDQKVVSVFGEINEAIEALHQYLPEEYGEDYKSIFQSVTVYKDIDLCGGMMIEAVDMEGDVIRIWIDEVKRKPTFSKK